MHAMTCQCPKCRARDRGEFGTSEFETFEFERSPREFEFEEEASFGARDGESPFSEAEEAFREEHEVEAWESERPRDPAPPRPAGTAPRRPRSQPPARRPWPASTRLYVPPAPCVCPVHGTEFVRWVQSTLNRVEGAGLPVNGVMNAASRGALRRFQRRKGLPADGIAGPDTEQALREARRPANAAAPPAEPQPEPAQDQGEVYEFETLELESPAAMPTLPGAFETSLIGTLRQRLTTPSLDAMSCRLLCAALLAYAPRPGATYPYYANAPDPYHTYYTKAGFLGRPCFIQGTKIIDACLIGTLQGSATNPKQKSVVLAFRGTDSTAADWLNNFEAAQVPFTKKPDVLVHKGFNDSVESFFGRGIVTTIKAQLRLYPGAQLYITGHSKGGALAYLAALLLHTNDIPVAGVISFEAPCAGHPSFAKAYNATGIDSLRYEFQNDIVPHLPPSGIFAKGLDILLAKSPVASKALSFLYPNAARSFTWEHVGKLCFIDWSGSKVGDSTRLQIERSARLSLLLAASATGGAGYVASKLAPWHSVSCGWSAFATSGSWRAICQTERCA